MNIIPFIFMLSLLFQACDNPQEEKSEQNTAGKDTLQNVNKVEEVVKSYPDISKDMLLGKIKPQNQDSLFAKIPVPMANRADLYLRREALQAFKEMRQAAKNDGIELTIISAFRSFTYQRWIWNSKFQGQRLSGGENMAKKYPDPKDRVEGILKYSAMPGTSRHHWGTDIDINSLNSAYFKTGKGAKVYQWLQQNAGSYGFFQTYTDNRKDGYQTEEWHWSYVPLAKSYLYNFSQKITYEDITGFEGSEHAGPLNVLERFVLKNINPKSLP
ncbi:MAG: M15 family metallopeptidase [Bacteroidales bacterium]